VRSVELEDGGIFVAAIKFSDLICFDAGRRSSGDSGGLAEGCNKDSDLLDRELHLVRSEVGRSGGWKSKREVRW
jgi:hypothetical protein